MAIPANKPGRPRRRGRSGLPDIDAESSTPVADQVAARHAEGPAGAGRHRVHRERPSCFRELLDNARYHARGAQRQAPRARGADRGPGRARRRRRHHRHQHGRPRYRHPARAATPDMPGQGRAARARASSVELPKRPPATKTATRPDPIGRPSSRRRPRQAHARLPTRERSRCIAAGRTLRHRHRAPRVPPYRQPAARPFRPSGRPGRDPVLPLAGRRPDAPLRRLEDGLHRRI